MRFRSLTPPHDDAESASTALLALEWTADDRDDNWLISYADLLSVIFAMVVLLFGRMLATAPLVGDADAVASTAEPPAVVGLAAVEPAAVDRAAVDRAMVEPLALERIETQPDAAAPALAPATPAAPSREDRLADLVEQRFSGRIETRRRERGLTLTIPAVALFDSARADLEQAAIPLLSELAATLREAGDTRISVEGHTDDVPLQGAVFDSNWALAAARANSVTRFLIDRGFAPARLQSVSFADTRPVAANATAEGRAANRRVELQIEVAGDAGER